MERADHGLGAARDLGLHARTQTDCAVPLPIGAFFMFGVRAFYRGRINNNLGDANFATEAILARTDILLDPIKRRALSNFAQQERPMAASVKVVLVGSLSIWNSASVDRATARKSRTPLTQNPAPSSRACSAKPRHQSLPAPLLLRFARGRTGCAWVR